MKKTILALMVLLLLASPSFAATINITSNATDTVAPVINSYSLSSSSVWTGSSVNLIINASDTSELSTVWATFRYPNTSTINHTAVLSSGNNQSGVFVVQFNDTAATGFYTVTYVFVNDSASYVSYNFSVLTFSAAPATSTSSYPPSFSGGLSETVPKGAPEAAPEEVPLPSPAKCIESWSCADWSECAAGSRTRTCTDANACGTAESKPVESESCAPTVAPAEQVPLGIPLGLWPFTVLMISALTAYVYIKKRKMKKEGKILRKVK